jgi:cysteine desulfurase/selenocysteine lyase
MDGYAAMLSPRTRVVAVSHVSNALGTVAPVAEITRRAREVGAAVVVDGAQAVPHLAVDVRALDCDFYCFSGHKLYGPTGTGVLYGKRERLLAMPPWQGGGDMILSVSFAKTTYAEPPQRFEAGTPNIAGIIGLGAAIDYVNGIGLQAIAAHERALLDHGRRVLAEVPGLTLHGDVPDKEAILSFSLAGVHPHDAGTVLDREGIAVRTGHHCAQPLMERLGIPGTVRASLALYNTAPELDALARALRGVVDLFA